MSITLKFNEFSDLMNVEKYGDKKKEILLFVDENIDDGLMCLVFELCTIYENKFELLKYMISFYPSILFPSIYELKRKFERFYSFFCEDRESWSLIFYDIVKIFSSEEEYKLFDLFQFLRERIKTIELEEEFINDNIFRIAEDFSFISNYFLFYNDGILRKNLKFLQLLNIYKVQYNLYKGDEIPDVYSYMFDDASQIESIFLDQVKKMDLNVKLGGIEIYKLIISVMLDHSRHMFDNHYRFSINDLIDEIISQVSNNDLLDVIFDDKDVNIETLEDKHDEIKVKALFLFKISKFQTIPFLDEEIIPMNWEDICFSEEENDLSGVNIFKSVLKYEYLEFKMDDTMERLL
jgi:hypothetical protein